MDEKNLNMVLEQDVLKFCLQPHFDETLKLDLKYIKTRMLMKNDQIKFVSTAWVGKMHNKFDDSYGNNDLKNFINSNYTA